MTIPEWALYSLVGFIAISLICSAVALWVSIFKDDAREERLRHLEEEAAFLREKIDQLEAEGLLKDKKISVQAAQIAGQAAQIIGLQEQLNDKERQICELRRQIKPGTL